MRRSGVKDLTNADINHIPEHGAMTIGKLLNHQNNLIRMMTETLRAGATADLPAADAGEEGAWKVAGLMAARLALAGRFRETLRATPESEFMKKRPDAPPVKWAEWPVLMRVLRPLVDMSHHTGQVAYARRQMGKPVA